MPNPNPKLKNFRPKFFIIDVDGVLTDGKFYYTTEGKIMKKFGPDDSDALSVLKRFMTIHMVSGDKRGFAITKKRMDDMKFPVDVVSTFERVEWIGQHYDLDQTIYMGDGIYDPLVFKAVGYGIAPNNAFFKTKGEADFITNARGGEGAVAEAVVHILDTFFEPFDIHRLNFQEGSGAWTTQK